MNQGEPLAFGAFADLYDSVRPEYPKQLVDFILDFASLPKRSQVIEVGAGTGKATLELARRGLQITCLEPSPQMAEILRRNCSGFPNVMVHVSTFESWPPPTEKFGLLVAAQSWHWVNSEVRLRRAADVLSHSGTIALFWNQAPQPPLELKHAFEAAYRRCAPDLLSNSNLNPRASYLDEPLAVSGIFTELTVRKYYTEQVFTSSHYLGLLDTYADYRNLPSQQHARLFDALDQLIGSAGGVVSLWYGSLLYLARLRESRSS